MLPGGIGPQPFAEKSVLVGLQEVEPLSELVPLRGRRTTPRKDHRHQSVYEKGHGRNMMTPTAGAPPPAPTHISGGPTPAHADQPPPGPAGSAPLSVIGRFRAIPIPGNGHEGGIHHRLELSGEGLKVGFQTLLSHLA